MLLNNKMKHTFIEILSVEIMGTITACYMRHMQAEGIESGHSILV